MPKVLVVDDTKNIRNLLKTCLEVEGYEVFTAANGQEALDYLNMGEFDLVFLDIKLPEISGTEVLRQIREMGNPVSVVIMTAFATVKNAVECTKLGAVAYLQKPFTAEKVRQTLKSISECLSNNESSQLELTVIEELITKGHLNEAYKRLKYFLSLEPACGKIYLLLSKVYEAQGNQEEALRFREIARQFDI